MDSLELLTVKHWTKLRRTTLTAIYAIIMPVLVIAQATFLSPSVAYAHPAWSGQRTPVHQDTEQILLPVSDLPMIGNYCTVQAGVSLHDPPHVGEFSIDIAGTPIRAYWFWTGRSVDSDIGDDTIVVNIENANGLIEDEFRAQQVLTARDGPYTWHSNFFRDDDLVYATAGTNTYAISDFLINNDARFNHGVGMVVIYESPECPYSRISGWFGNDTFHWSRLGELGPDSNIMCEAFPPSEVARNLHFGLAIGGVAGQERGNSIWYMTGNDAYPTQITPDENDIPNPGAVEIFDPLNGDPGREWDFSSTELVIPPGDTYACAQIESPADDNGISAIWSGLISSMPLDVPEIDIEKTAEPPLVRSGGEVTFTIKIINTGLVTLTDVVVTDTLVPECQTTVPLMAPGAEEIYTCVAPAVTQAFTNTVEVIGNPPLGPPVTDSDDALVAVYLPAIEIVKSPEIQTVVSGSSAAFSITVRNSGEITLTDVTVTDMLAPICNRSFLEPLGPGQSSTFTCMQDNVDEDLINVAIATGLPPHGPPVIDGDEARVLVTVPPTLPTPGISVEKLPNEQSVLIGASAIFTIRIQNSAEIPLTNIIVTDANTPTCDKNFSGLEVGQIEEYTCSAADVQASFTNVVTVVGDPPSGPSVGASDSADVIALGPAIDIEKTPDLQTVPSGSDVSFVINVTNVGNVPLTDVTVADSVAPACAVTIGTLSPGQQQSYTCVLNQVEEDLTNIATVTANPPTGTPLTDQDDARVIVVYPKIEIAKEASSPVVLAGSPVDFTIRVVNSGDVVLSNVRVIDSLVPTCSAELGTLSVGEVNEYSCTLPQVDHSLKNTATVVGTSPTGENVQADDTATVTSLTPAISIDKLPDVQLVDIDDTATFTIVVRNIGETALADVTVSDALAPECDSALGNLPIGEQVTYVCTLSGVAGEIINTAIVTGTPMLSVGNNTSSTAQEDVSDQDSAIVEIATLSAIGDKVWLDQNLNGLQDENEPGIEAVTVGLYRNAEGEPLEEVGRTQTNEDGLYLFPALDVGSYLVEFTLPENYSFSQPQAGADELDSDPNIVSGRTKLFYLGAQELIDTIDAGLIGIPSLVLVKEDSGNAAQPGGTIVYTLAVTNTGNATALDVVLTEFLPANTTYNSELSPPEWLCRKGDSGETQCNYIIGDLDAGESARVTFVVKINAPLPLSITVIENQATVNSTNAVKGEDVVMKMTPLTPTAIESMTEPVRFYIPFFR